MALSDDLRELMNANDNGAKILTFDIETTRALTETFSLFSKYTHIDRVRMPSRILCFSARWLDQDENIFHAVWDDDMVKLRVADPGAYRKMIKHLFKLLSEADIVVTWNGNRFDLQWVEEECGRLGLGRPVPYKTVDLFVTAKRKFGRGLMSLKLDWSSRMWLHDAKVSHSATDLWDDIRYGNKTQQRAAQKLMTEYCAHDTELTENLFLRYLPWLGLNLALYRQDIFDETLHCLACQGKKMRLVNKKFTTSAYAYPQYRCDGCGTPARGKRSRITTELRPIR